MLVTPANTPAVDFRTQISFSPSVQQQPSKVTLGTSPISQNALSLGEYEHGNTSTSPKSSTPVLPRARTISTHPRTSVQGEPHDATNIITVGRTQAVTYVPSTQPALVQSSPDKPFRVQDSYQPVASPSHLDLRSPARVGSQSLSPAIKRRRLNHPSSAESSAKKVASTDNVEDTIPSVEIDQNDTQVTATSITDSAKKQSAKPRTKAKTSKSKGKKRAEDTASAVEVDTIRAVPFNQKKAPKSKRKGKQRAEDLAADVVVDATRAVSRRAKERVRKGRKRSVTPENAETIEIAPSLMKMADLCKDIRVGQKSNRELELQELDWTEVARKQREKKQRVANQETPPLETVDQMLERVAREREQQPAQAFPNTRIVNGQIVIDESSLRIDRHANAEAAREAEQQDIIDESQLTRRINSASWMKREKPESWGEELTDRLYNGLRMFGTDFQMISQMFPGRNRRQIKLKFVREERTNSDRIREALLGERIPVSMEEFSKMTNTTYRDPKDLAREIEEDEKRLKEDQVRENEAKEEAIRQRAAEAAVEGAAVGDDSSAKENEVQQIQAANPALKGGKRGKKPGPKISRKIGRSKIVKSRGVVEVLATIEEPQ